MVALIGTTNGVEELEGNLGMTDVSSKVQAVCNWFGPSDLNQMNLSSRDKSKGAKQNTKPIVKFLGGSFQKRKKEQLGLALLTTSQKTTPPFLIMHGAKDELVPIEQSAMFHKSLRSANVDSEYIMVEDGVHSFFTDAKELDKVADFFKDKLK